MSDYDDPKKNVVDAEIITDASPRFSRSGSCSGQSFSSGGTRYTYFSMMGPSAPGHQGLPSASIITLALFIGCLLQWGFLAGLGFAFFYAVASACGIWYNFRRLLQGSLPNPWLTRILSWGVSLLLVSWLV